MPLSVYEPVALGTHAERGSAHESPGIIYIESDTGFAFISDGGQWRQFGGGPPTFSGCAASGDGGQTLVSSFDTGPIFDAKQCDTDGYLGALDQGYFVVPHDGKYLVILHMQAGDPFTGEYQLSIPASNHQTMRKTGKSGATDAEPVQDQIVNIVSVATGTHISLLLNQASGTDQVVYPHARITFLGA